MEDRLKEKVDVTAFEELEEKMQKLEISVDQKVTSTHGCHRVT